MGNSTEIEWADSTLNTGWGCTKVSEGCKNCYMYRLSKVYGKNPEGAQPRSMKNIRRSVNDLGEPKVVFLNSMTDTFHTGYSDDMISEWLAYLETTPHTYIMLTKRIERAAEYFRDTRPVPYNMWLGTSVENRRAYHRLDTLRAIDAKVRFVSLEPLLESVHDVNLQGIHWCIVGGESDFTTPRPFDVQWAREIRDQCVRYKTAFFYKQSGGTRKNHGVWGSNILDGKTYLEMPQRLATKESTLKTTTTTTTTMQSTLL